ncbi:MAG: hypothetical protein Q4Q53_06620 [Methanocorpusculum sp.]|nr:hypothetical protein [Methanocorpusculum sp.]
MTENSEQNEICTEDKIIAEYKKIKRHDFFIDVMKIALGIVIAVLILIVLYVIVFILCFLIFIALKIPF